MRTASLAALVLAALAAGGCGRDPQDAERTAAGAAAAAASRSAELLAAAMASYDERWLELNPLAATERGDHRYDDRFGDYLSPTWLADSLANEQDSLEKLRGVDPGALAARERIGYDAFKLGREIAIESFRYPTELMPIDQTANAPVGFALLGSGAGAHTFVSTADYDHFLSRMDGFVGWVEQSLNNMRSGIAKGIVEPRIVIERTIPQLDALGVENPRDSVFWRPIVNLPAGMSIADRRRIVAAYEIKLRDEVLPAYRRLRDYLRNDYLPQARSTASLAELPNGAAWYAYLVRAYTSTEMKPDELHELGLAEVARLRREMERAKATLGVAGDLRGLFESLAGDRRFVATDPRELIDAYTARRQRIPAAVPSLFAIVPRSDFVVRAVEPFRARSAPSVAYQPGSADGQRPGILYVNTYDLRSRPTWQVDALFLREAIPGRHFQTALVQETTELPAFRRHASFAAYDEGWALYAVSLGRELGAYADGHAALGALGALVAEMRAAARMVVDTGLHARGWTRQRAIEYLRSNTGLGGADVVADVERCIALPGQALADTIGALKIRSLRERSRRALGARFDLRQFHAQVLDGGSLPLTVLEAKIGLWIESQRRPTQ